MKRLGIFAIAAVFFVAGCASTSKNPGPAALDAAWAKAFKAADVEGIMACYAPDAVDWEPGAPEAKGHDAIREGYREFFAANTVVDVSNIGTQYKVAGDLAFAWGKSSMTYVPKATGKTIVATGRFSSAAEKRNGKWMYIVDHASSDPAP